MQTEAIFQDVQEVLRDIFDDGSLVITNETNAASVPGWDSLTHARIVRAIEQHFKVKFAVGELRLLRNVGDIILLVQKKLDKAKV